MNTFYKYDFVSAEPLVALVKEEFKSYFDTGAVDDLLFPIYIQKCLDKLGKGSYDIRPAILTLNDFQVRLPDDFFGVREAWMATDVSISYQLPSAVYEQVTTRIDTPEVSCSECNNCGTPDTIKAVYKTTGTAFAYYQKQYMLQPGNIFTNKNCSEYCANINASSPDSYDIQGNKLSTTFRSGTVYLLYYSKENDCNGYPMIPDNFRIKEYIEAFLKAKIYENLSNQAVDETFNQINGKAVDYKARADEAYIIASTEGKKETVYNKVRRIKTQQRRLNKFNL